MSRTQVLALFLATGLAFEGCASRLKGKPPLPLSNTVNGITVRADPIPGDGLLFDEMTRLTVRLENLDQWFAGARGVEIAIDLPDGSRFPAMPPAMAQEQADAQRERLAPDLEEPVEPQPDPVPGTRTAEKVAAGLVLATCLPTLAMYVYPPAILIAPLCLGTYAAVSPMLPKNPKPPSDAERRRRRLSDDLHALRKVDLMRGETATAILYFPIAGEVVRDTRGATLTVPFVDGYERDLAVVRVPLAEAGRETSLHEQRRLFDQIGERAQELRAAGAVDRAVVAG